MNAVYRSINDLIQDQSSRSVFMWCSQACVSLNQVEKPMSDNDKKGAWMNWPETGASIGLGQTALLLSSWHASMYV